MKKVILFAVLSLFSLASAAHGGHAHAAPATTASAAVPANASPATATAGEKVQIAISGMHCSSCASSVRAELTKIQGLEVVDINPEKGLAVVKVNKVDDVLNEKFKTAVKAAGYEATSISVVK